MKVLLGTTNSSKVKIFEGWLLDSLSINKENLKSFILIFFRTKMDSVIKPDAKVPFVPKTGKVR